MDDGGPSLLDVISDPLLLQSFLEGETQNFGKTQEDGKVSKSMISTSQLSGQEHVKAPEVVQKQGLFPAVGLKPSLESMGYSFHGAVVTSMPNSLGMGNPMIGGIQASSSANTILRLSADPGMQQGFSLADAASLRVSSSQVVTTFQYLQSQAGLTVHPTLSASGATIHHIPSPGGATIHHIPSSVQSQHHRPSSAPAPQIAVPSPYNVKSPGQGPPSVNSLPPPSPIQQIRSPKPPHAPSPVSSWSPAPSASTSSRGTGLPVKQQTTGTVNQVTSSSISHKQNPVKAQTSQVQVPKQPVVQILTPQQNTAGMPRSSHSSGRPIQPKPQQILPKPPVSSSNQFSTPLLKSSGGSASPSVQPSQGSMGIGLNAPVSGSPLVLGQSQPGVIAGPQGTIVLNQIIPGLPGQNPILIQGNLGSLTGVQLALRPQHPGSLTVSNHSGHVMAANNSALVAALQNPGQPAQHLLDQGKSPLTGQQTLFIPNTITQQGLPSQGLTLGGTGIPTNSIVQSSAHPHTVLNTRPNIILAPRVMGPQQCIQLQQIQTPQGPITVALAPGQTITLPQLQAAVGGTVSVPSVLAPGQGVMPSLPVQHPLSHSLVPSQQPQIHDIQGQQVVSGMNSPLQSFSHKSETFVQVSQSPPLQNQQGMSLTPDTSSESSKPAKVPSVNLAELLKEHGILDSTPPSSPAESTTHDESEAKSDALTVISLPSCTALTQVSVSHSIFSSTVNSQAYYSLPTQAQFSMAPDGSLVMQQANQTTGGAVETSVVMSSQCSNTSAAGNLTIPNSGRLQSGHSALLERLNAGPAVQVPDVVTSMAVASSESSTLSSRNTSLSSGATLLPLTVQNINNNVVSASGQIQSGYVTLPIITSSTDSKLSAVSAVPFTTSCTTTNTVLTAASILSDNNINHLLVGVQPVQLPGNTGPTLVANVKQPIPVPSGSAVVTPTVTDTNSDVYNSSVQKTLSTSSQLQSLPDSNSRNKGGPSNRGQTNPLNIRSQQVFKRLQEQIGELLSNKSPSSHQQQLLQQLLNLQQKIVLQAQMVQSHQNVPQVQPSLRVIAPALPNVSSTVQAQPSNIASVNVPTQVRIGNQILTLAPQQCQPVHTYQQSQKGITSEQQQAFIKQQQNQQTLVLKLQKQNLQPQLSQADSSQSQLTTTVSMANQSVALKKIIQIQTIPRPSLPTVSRTTLFQQQLARDHESVTKPDIKRAFSCAEDLYKRLLCYHVYNTKVPGKEEIQKVDNMFERVSQQLLEKSRRMVNKYCYLLMKDSMRICSNPERVMLERLFIQDERQALKRDKEAISAGKDLSLEVPEVHSKALPDETSLTEKQDFTNYQVDELSTPPLEEVNTTVKEEIVEFLECQVGTSASESLRFNMEDCIQASKESFDKRISGMNKNFQCHKQFKEEKVLEGDKCEIKEATKSNTLVLQNQSSFLSSQNNSRKRENSSDPHEDDIMTKIRKELNISLLDEEEEEDHEPDPGHIDFDFEPPVIRREEAREKAIIKSYSSVERDLNLEYNFSAVNGTCVWPVSYSDSRNKHASQTESGLESILTSRDHEPELDLSGIEGLDALEEPHRDLHNGISSEIDDMSMDGELTYEKLRHHDQRTSGSHIGFSEIPSHTDREESDELNAQVQSAIKSILELQSSESRSYYSDGDGDFISHMYNLEGLNSQRDPSVTNYEVNLTSDMELTSESDAAIDEAVQSILF